MKKILFVHLVNDYSSLGIEYISASLKRAGHETDLILHYGEEKHFANRLYDKVETFKPDFICFSVVTFDYLWASKIAQFLREITKAKLIFGGIHPTSCPEEVIKHPFVDYLVIGEGDEAIIELVEHPERTNIKNVWTKKNGRIIRNDVRPLLQNLDLLPFPDKELFFENAPYLNDTYFCISGKGCPFNCLAGDTIIHTSEGDMKIKELAKIKRKIGVYTMNTRTGEVFIADAINCHKTKEKAEMVRVNFNDGTHIDCTPDHKFLTFKNSNQFVKLREHKVEAKDLQPHMSVHALKFNKALGYIDVCWGRRKRKKMHRMIYEYYNDEKLSRKDMIHHIDKNKENNKIDNLLKTYSKEHISKHHPEVSERMKNNNPAKHMTQEWRDKLTKAITGKRRSYETRLRLREAKLGKKNPMYKDGSTKFKYKYKSRVLGHKEYLLARIKMINHTIKSVIQIHSQDVYNLEVPATGWYFANNVLVSNCSYCFNNRLRNIYSGQGWVRKRSVGNLIEELKTMKQKHGFKQVSFFDDCFTNDIKWLREFCKRYKKEINLPFRAISHPMFVTEESARLLADAGCIKVQLGAQSPIEKIRSEICKRFHSNEVLINAVKNLRKFGIIVSVDHIFGLPTEKISDYDEGLEFYIDLKPHWYFGFWLQYYPNTEIVEIGKKHGLITDEDIENVIKGKISYGCAPRNKGTVDVLRFMYFIPLMPKWLSRFLLRKKLYPLIFRYDFLNNIPLLLPHFYSPRLFMALVREMRKVLGRRNAQRKVNKYGASITIPDEFNHWNEDLIFKPFSYFRYENEKGQLIREEKK